MLLLLWSGYLLKTFLKYYSSARLVLNMVLNQRGRGLTVIIVLMMKKLSVIKSFNILSLNPNLCCQQTCSASFPRDYSSWQVGNSSQAGALWGGAGPRCIWCGLQSNSYEKSWNRSVWNKRKTKARKTMSSCRGKSIAGWVEIAPKYCQNEIFNR